MDLTEDLLLILKSRREPFSPGGKEGARNGSVDFFVTIALPETCRIIIHNIVRKKNRQSGLCGTKTLLDKI